MTFQVPVDPEINPDLRVLLEERQEELAETFSPPGSRSNSQNFFENICDLTDAVHHRHHERDSSDDEEGDHDDILDEVEASELARQYSQAQPQASEDDNHRELDDGSDELDKSSVVTVMQTGCGCTRQCYTNFTVDRVWEYRLNMSEFPKDQLDVLLLAKLEQSEVMGEPVRGGKRARQNFSYSFDGQLVCEKVWRYIHNIGTFN